MNMSAHCTNLSSGLDTIAKPYHTYAACLVGVSASVCLCVCVRALCLCENVLDSNNLWKNYRSKFKPKYHVLCWRTFSTIYILDAAPYREKHTHTYTRGEWEGGGGRECERDRWQRWPKSRRLCFAGSYFVCLARVLGRT